MPRRVTTAAQDLAPLCADLEAFRYPKGRNPVDAFLQRYSTAASRRAMESALRRIARLCRPKATIPVRSFPWHALRYQHTRALRAALAEAYKPKGANQRLSALRGILKECWRLEWMEADPYHRAIDLEPVRGSALMRGRALEVGEVRALFDACKADDSPRGARDLAILAFGLGCGLRRSEIVSIDLEHVDRARAQLQVVGKGEKARRIFLPEGTQRALDAWLRRRGAAPGPLFQALDHHPSSKAQPGRRLNAQTIYRICEQRAAEADVDRFTPHDLRRTFVTRGLELCHDIRLIGLAVGHAKMDTTAGYDRREDDALRDIAQRIELPV